MTPGIKSSPKPQLALNGAHILAIGAHILAIGVHFRPELSAGRQESPAWGQARLSSVDAKSSRSRRGGREGSGAAAVPGHGKATNPALPHLVPNLDIIFSARSMACRRSVIWRARYVEEDEAGAGRTCACGGRHRPHGLRQRSRRICRRRHGTGLGAEMPKGRGEPRDLPRALPRPDRRGSIRRRPSSFPPASRMSAATKLGPGVQSAKAELGFALRAP